jgi:uncharacterized repeat protein (TIGR04138 family)
MNTTQKSMPQQLRFHPNAYLFLFAALRRTQKMLNRSLPDPDDQERVEGRGEDEVGRPGQVGGRRGDEPIDERSHISGRELLEGVRLLAHEQFGLMARTVFHCWGIHSTDDFGRMVFELIERGEMSKTDSDQLSDFFDVFDFAEALDEQYAIDVSRAF